jgi:hypothetical protein
MSQTGTAAALRAQYRALVIDWDAAKGTPGKANQIFSTHHALYKRLRDWPAGREAITGLLDDPVTAARLVAATHSLRWEPERAQRVLEEIEQQPAGLYAVDAKWTLRPYRAGTLNLDW